MADDTVLYRKGNVRVADYHAMIRDQSLSEDEKKRKVIDFIRGRFTERYITPLRAIEKDLKNGFCTMAICCLMIEALESFWEGLSDTKAGGASSRAFISFFNRSDNLKDFRGKYSEQFYSRVRCGILHQAETTGGWKVRRDGILFDSDTLTVNAGKFHDEMECCFRDLLFRA